VQTNMIPTSTHASGTDYKFRVLISKVNNSLLRNHSLQHFPPLSHPSSSTNNYNFPIRYSSVAANEHRNTKSMKCSETLQTHHDIRIHTPTNETTGKIPVIMAMTMFTKNHSNRLQKPSLTPLSQSPTPIQTPHHHIISCRCVLSLKCNTHAKML
jgi:hypothetical protein